MNKDQFLFLINEKQHYIYLVFCIVLTISFLNQFKDKKTDKPVISNSVDTYIPKGFVLIPIEVINPEALNDIIGDFGYVDLYKDYSKTNSPSFKLLIKNIRLLKSPVDPSIIAVLSPDTMVKPIVAVNKKFKITIKPKNNKEAELVTQNEYSKRKIFE